VFLNTHALLHRIIVARSGSGVGFQQCIPQELTTPTVQEAEYQHDSL
jgi:hypothetical protein